MTFYQKFDELCKQKGVSTTFALGEIGLAQSSATTWKNMIGVPRNSTVKKVSDYFGVPQSYLRDDCSVSVNGNNNIVGNNNTVGADSQEAALIELYRSLDIIGKAKLLAYAAGLSDK